METRELWNIRRWCIEEVLRLEANLPRHQRKTPTEVVEIAKEFEKYITR